MQTDANTYETPLDGLDWLGWLKKLGKVTERDGYVESLGLRHAAVFIEEKPTLLVTFETFQKINAQSAAAHPLGWDMHKALGWSHLCLVSDGETWFRDEAVYGYLDRLVDDGFFEDFEQVVFYGAGDCGYAAAAFSVVAPGAQVLLVSPQATLDPRITEWDTRFRQMRRTSFTDRYGYAPDMVEAAQHTFLLYDPEIEEDAMHASLFTRPNITKFRMRHGGRDLESTLLRMNILQRILARVPNGKLDVVGLARLFRERRQDGAYQFTLLQRITDDDRPWLAMLLSGKVLEQREAPPFRRAHTLSRKKLGLEDS